MSDFYANFCQRAQGEPEVHCIGERVHLYPTGIGGIHLTMTVDKWNEIAKAVDIAMIRSTPPKREITL